MLAPCDGEEDPGLVPGTLDGVATEVEGFPLWLVGGTMPVPGGFVPVAPGPDGEPPLGVG